MAGGLTELSPPSLVGSLLPCVICNRTFLPEALSRHQSVCQKTANKKRKVFDSSKQRLSGTGIDPEVVKSSPSPPVRRRSCSRSSWRDKHHQLLSTVRSARGGPAPPPAGAPPPDYEQCPFCARHFGPKAADRHINWCKEQKSRLPDQRIEAAIAKGRLNARTKYVAPLPLKPRPKRVSAESRLSREVSPAVSTTSSAAPNVASGAGTATTASAASVRSPVRPSRDYAKEYRERASQEREQRILERKKSPASIQSSGYGRLGPPPAGRHGREGSEPPDTAASPAASKDSLRKTQSFRGRPGVGRAGSVKYQRGSKQPSVPSSCHPEPVYHNNNNNNNNSSSSHHHQQRDEPDGGEDVTPDRHSYQRSVSTPAERTASPPRTTLSSSSAAGDRGDTSRRDSKSPSRSSAPPVSANSAASDEAYITRSELNEYQRLNDDVKQPDYDPYMTAQRQLEELLSGSGPSSPSPVPLKPNPPPFKEASPSPNSVSSYQSSSLGYKSTSPSYKSSSPSYKSSSPSRKSSSPSHKTSSLFAKSVSPPAKPTPPESPLYLSQRPSYPSDGSEDITERPVERTVESPSRSAFAQVARPHSALTRLYHLPETVVKPTPLHKDPIAEAINILNEYANWRRAAPASPSDEDEPPSSPESSHTVVNKYELMSNAMAKLNEEQKSRTLREAASQERESVSRSTVESAPLSRSASETDSHTESEFERLWVRSQSHDSHTGAEINKSKEDIFDDVSLQSERSASQPIPRSVSDSGSHSDSESFADFLSQSVSVERQSFHSTVSSERASVFHSSSLSPDSANPPVADANDPTNSARATNTAPCSAGTDSRRQSTGIQASPDREQVPMSHRQQGDSPSPAGWHQQQWRPIDSNYRSNRSSVERCTVAPAPGSVELQFSRLAVDGTGSPAGSLYEAEMPDFDLIMEQARRASERKASALSPRKARMRGLDMRQMMGVEMVADMNLKNQQQQPQPQPAAATPTQRFCHECGSGYPVRAAKFCCNCGAQRLI